jgi:pimeloyl-ACP methyl ester carboxylesterase
MWNAQVNALAEAGLRCVCIDRRGHGGSPVVAGGYDLDSLADDVTGVLERLDLHDVVLIGHSMGGLEAVRVAAGAAAARVTALVLSAPTTPCLTASEGNPFGVPASMFEVARTMMANDIAGWIAANTEGYWGVGDDLRPIETQWTQQTLYSTPLRVLIETNRTVTAADVRPHLALITCPTLVIQGDTDRSVPLEISGKVTAALLPAAELAVVEGAGHGLYTSFAATYNERLADFIDEN